MTFPIFKNTKAVIASLLHEVKRRGDLLEYVKVKELLMLFCFTLSHPIIDVFGYANARRLPLPIHGIGIAKTINVRRRLPRNFSGL